MTNNPLKETTYLPDKTFPINIFRVGGIRVHWHDHMEWIFVQEGKARIQVDAEIMTVQKGEVAFVNSKQLHSATALETGTRMLAIVFNEALVRNSGLDSTEDRYFSPIFNQKLHFPNFLQANEPLWQDIRKAIGQIVEEFEQQQTGFELLIKAELFRIFGLLFRHDRQLAASSAPRQNRKSDFTLLLQDLRSRFHSVFTVAEAAERVNMSPTYFCRRFKQVTGKTLVEYLQMLRINEAERLLVETDTPVTTIAELVGFGSITYFGRVFKAYKHHSPTEARLKARQGESAAGPG
jgi:AraC family transcriptional activator of pobA